MGRGGVTWMDQTMKKKVFKSQKILFSDIPEAFPFKLKLVCVGVKDGWV